MTELTIEQARKTAINASLKEPAGEDALDRTLQIIRHLGYVQIDTLQAVQRAHHHVIWSRFPEYRPEYLERLLEQRRIFEYWTHALALVPMDDFPLYYARMAAAYDPHDKWEKDRLQKYGGWMEPIKEVMQKNGAMTPAEIEECLSEKVSASIIRSALNLLFFRGEVTISHRDKFRKVYRLAKECFPDKADIIVPDSRERGRIYTLKALQAMGIANRRDIRDYLGNIEKDGIDSAIEQLQNAGEILPCSIKGLNGTYYQMAKQDVLSEPNGRSCRILSPFDPLVINRSRLQRLFEFDYRLECYLPAEKRVYGYFVLPVLWQDRFMARMDVRVDRRNKILNIHKLILEEKAKTSGACVTDFAAELARFADFNSCQQTRLEQIEPAGPGKPFTRTLTEQRDDIIMV